MWISACSEKGITLTEVLISLLLTSVGILALVSVQPRAWMLSGKSDFLGRAAGILHAELETQEARLMNPCQAAASLTTTRSVWASGEDAPQPGDAAFTLRTAITENGNGTWTITVRVIWPGESTGLAESLIVTRQEYFRFPQGCT